MTVHPCPTAPSRRSSRGLRLHVLAALACAALLAPVAACSGGAGSASPDAPATQAAVATGQATPAQEASAPGTSAASPSPAPGDPQATGASLTPLDEAPAPASDWLTGPVHQDYSGDSDLVITDVRVGAHEGFDRVVVELAGTATPGWDTQWVESATTQGKGDPVSVEGEHVLQLTGSGATMPVEPSQQAVEYTGPAALGLGGAGIGSVYMDLTFEGQYQLVVGAHSSRYRVYALTQPTRVVVDVAHAG